MLTNRKDGKSLIFYPLTGYNGQGVPIVHGETAILAASTSDWTYRSVGLLSMYAYVWSDVTPTIPETSYLGHVESAISAELPDITGLYPQGSQFPLHYLGVDPGVATLVWLTIDTSQAGSNALAATAVVGGSNQSITTLTLPGSQGALGFVAISGTSPVMVSCQYGTYDARSGQVAWSGSGTLFLAYQNGSITISNDGNFPADWQFSTPTLQGNGTWRVALNGSSSSLALFHNAGYSGATTTLEVDDSVLLRDALSNWNWKSAKLGSEHLLSHTLIGDRTAFDFRTYRDSYDVSDVEDFSDSYPTLLSSAAVQATALGDNDVVVRVTLEPAVHGQHMVAAATQTWPQLTETASVANGIHSIQGVLAVFNKVQSVTGIPLNVGTLDSDSGTVNWQVSTSLVALWNNFGGAPQLSLAQDAPAGWTLSALQSTGNAGEYSCVLSGVALSDYSVTLSADPMTIADDGISASLITARVVDNSGAPVEGIAVNWSTSLGSLTSVVPTTDQTGSATATLTDNGVPGTAVVTTSIAGSSAQVSVEVTAVAAPTIKVMGGRWSLSWHYWPAHPTSLVALDIDTQKPVAASWQYEGNSSATQTVYFDDIHPEKRLLVQAVSGGAIVTLREGNITGNGLNDQPYSAFTAIADDGTLLAWGNNNGSQTIPSILSGVDGFYSACGSLWGFCALQRPGNLFSWGGTDTSPARYVIPTWITDNSDYKLLAGTSYAFAALRRNGKVVAWGDANNGGSVPPDYGSLTDITAIVGSTGAFAVLREGGSLLSWGDPSSGGTLPNALASFNDIVSLVASGQGFAALRSNGAVVAWGASELTNYPPYTDVVSITANWDAFVALRANGQVVAWGNSDRGGVIPPAVESLTDVVSVSSNSESFAALRTTGQVVAWGKTTGGGDVPTNIAQLTDIVSVVGSGYAYAALRASGQVVAWGDSSYGGTIPSTTVPLLSNVRAIYAAHSCFCALKDDNTVVVWGNGDAGDMGKLPLTLQGNISYLLANT